MNRDAAGRNPNVSDTSPAAIGDAPSVCELVSNNDIEVITGIKYTRGVTVTREAQLNRCGFEPVTAGSGSGVTVALYLENVTDSKTAFQITPDMTPATTDVGDAAYWSSQQRSFVARKENRVIIVAFQSDGGDQQRWGAEIARKALERM